MDRDELFQRIDSTWQELQSALDGIPPERATEPGAAGEWSVKDLLGHITFWERNLVTELQNLGPDEVVEALDVDEINAREHDLYKNRPLGELQAEFQESHEALMQVDRPEYADQPTVVQLLQKGYALHDRVLRPAQVAVSKTS